MIRDKDKKLAESCGRMAQASVDALQWFDDNRKRIAGLQGLQRAFKKHAVEARKLALAAARPMSVGVFGASQAGKSFLIGALIAPQERPAQVVFGQGDNTTKLNFLDEVNPQGGDETTGLVTRFSIAEHETLPGHDVALRLLSEVDIVKILANAFLFDLSAEADEEATSERIAALREELEAAAGADDVDPLKVEDVFELRDYFEHSLPRHPLSREPLSERYWSFAEDVVPRLAPEQRARAFAPLWGELTELTDLYRQLKSALDQLGHPEWAYVPLEAITERSGGILHVGTLYGLDLADPEKRTPVMVAVKNGPSASLPKPVVTALTAELRVTLDAAPWPFFEHTDLLDFPGARSRLEGTVKEWLRSPDKHEEGRAQCYLRGKVAVLFDKYAADLDLNTMLLCVGPENQEVRKLPELIDGWIGQTHGRQPQDREGRRVSLFFCMTKADKLFDLAAGETPPQKVKIRMSNNLGFYPGWTETWTPGKGFDNCYLIRNPNFMREDLFDYGAKPEGAREESIPPEAKIRDDKVEWLSGFRDAFMADDTVQKHMALANEKWEAMLSLNDGGITYLADRLAPVCDPDLKFEQVQPRAEKLAHQILSELGNFYEEGDLQKRVAERGGKATEVQRQLREAPGMIGCFLRELVADEASLGQRYLDTMRRAGEEGEAEGPRHQVMPSSFMIDLPGDEQAPGPAAAEKNGNHLFGKEAIENWLDELRRKAGDEELSSAYNLSPAHFLFVVEELERAAQRLGLADRIEAHVRATPGFERPDEVVHRVAMGASLIINGLVNHLGCDEEEAPEEAEDGADSEAPPPPTANIIFERPSEIAVGELPPLPPDPTDMQRLRARFPTMWLTALSELARRNASWGQGGMVDVEQNRRLGDLIALVKS